MPQSQDGKQKQQRSLKSTQETQINGKTDRTNEPFFDQDLRRNRLQKLANQSKLSKELDEEGLSSVNVGKAQEDTMRPVEPKAVP